MSVRGLRYHVAMQRVSGNLGGPPAQTQFWGWRGHAMINREAARELPTDMPAFFRGGGDSLEALASQPDRWKMRGLPSLDVDNRPDHYLNLERLGGRALPSERYSYVAMVADNHLQPTGQPAYSLGLLPYAIAEGTEKLTAEFALWRHETQTNGFDTPLAHQLEQNAIYTAGVLGHFVADASQPLHVTAHHDGWNPQVEANPNGFSTQPGIHSRFESQFVEAAVTPGAVDALLKPPAELKGTALEVADAYCRETNGKVKKLYTLDKQGRLDPSKPSAEGRAFAVACVASGAQMLRNLWYTAWTRSEALEASMPDSTNTLEPQLTHA